MEEKKKDWLPIIIYIAIFFGIQVIIGGAYGFLQVKGYNLDEGKMLSLTNILIYMIIGLTFIIIYHKRLLDDCRRLTKKDVIVMAVCMVVLYGLNYGLSTLFLSLGVEMSNQDMAVSLLNNYKHFMVVSLVLFGPIAEEIVYRYSLSTIAKNDIAFLIISSLVFGAIHGLGTVTIIYVVMGAILGLCYLKTDKNIVSSIVIHIINNAISVLFMLALIG